MTELQIINQITANQPALTATQMQAYWRELDGLLLRIESATTPYHVLGIECTADYQDIWSAYQQHVALLYPSYSINSIFPEAMQIKVERAFAKISRAFAVLANASRRRRYDGVTSQLVRPLAEAAETAPAAAQVISLPEISIVTPEKDACGENVPVREESAAVVLTSNKYPRRFPRFKMRLPVRLTGYSHQGNIWQEETVTGEVSRMGALVRMKQRVRHGTVLYLNLPLPDKLRSYSFRESDYKTYAIVRSVIPRGDGVRDVGLEFLGKNPPEGYFDKPWDTFRTESWRGAERRRMPRINRVEPVTLEFFTDTKQLLAKGEASTETLSRSGACILIDSLPEEFDLVGISAADYNFESLAVVANCFSGQDGRQRLCLQFIDQEWPI